MADKIDVESRKDARTKPGHKRVEKRMSAAPSRKRHGSIGDTKNEDNSMELDEKNGKKKDTNSLGSLASGIAVMVLIIMGIITLSDKESISNIFGANGSIEGIDSGKGLTLPLFKAGEDYATTSDSIIDKIEEERINAKKNTYNFQENLYTNGLYKFYKTEDFMSKVGIDVSYYQKDIDWKKVKNAGVDYAIVRVGYRGYKTGEIVADNSFTKHIEGALDAGIRVGVYFFTQAVNTKEAQEEADYVIKNIKKYNITYPIVIDTEETSDKKNARSSSSKIDKKTLTDICIAFCDRVDSAGYSSAIYASKNWFYSQLDLERLEKYDKWLANYAQRPDFPFQFSMWQYDDKGKIDGISGNVDVNMSLKDYGN